MTKFADNAIRAGKMDPDAKITELDWSEATQIIQPGEIIATEPPLVTAEHIKLRPFLPIEEVVRILFDNTPGEDPEREGIQETPARFAKAWAHWTSGYEQDPAALLKSFEEGNYDEMVIVKDIPLYSKCEHHLADIFGTATVAYIPSGRVVGLSKLSRLVNVFARRLQVQERMTVQIADALAKSPLSPKGVGVRLKCRHMCMESRGICQQGHHTVTTALRGVLTEGQPRDEFLREAQ